MRSSLMKSFINKGEIITFTCRFVFYVVIRLLCQGNSFLMFYTKRFFKLARLK